MFYDIHMKFSFYQIHFIRIRMETCAWLADSLDYCVFLMK